MANEIILQKNMNTEEKEQALKLFKQLLTEKTEILKDVRYTPAQTIEQACFISGGFENEAGEFDAVFFPNSEFKGKKIVCLAFQDGKPCMVVRHEIKLEKVNKTWESVEKLENLIYENEERDEINHLKNAINYNNRNISTLEIFKRIRTKSGGNFKKLLKNFENGRFMSLQTCLYSREFKSCLNINYRGFNIAIYIKNDIEKVTPEEIEAAIKNEIKINQQIIKDNLNKIEIIHAETLEAIKIFNNVYEKSKKFKTKILRKILENRLYKI